MYLSSLQCFIPARMKFLLRPSYYRKLFRNRLHVLFWPTFRCNYDVFLLYRVHEVRLCEGIYAEIGKTSGAMPN
jgi:hypothetical protein